MTKRFTGEMVKNYFKIDKNGEEMLYSEVIDTLNNLYEENEQLKLHCQNLEETLSVSGNKHITLQKENEQLKQDKKRLIGYLHRYGKVDVEDIDEVILDKEYYDEYGELYGGDVE